MRNRIFLIKASLLIVMVSSLCLAQEATWKEVTSGTSKALRGIHFVDANTAGITCKDSACLTYLVQFGKS